MNEANYLLADYRGRPRKRIYNVFSVGTAKLSIVWWWKTTKLDVVGVRCNSKMNIKMKINSPQNWPIPHTGFGFVTFADPSNLNSVLQNGPHCLDGRTIDPKPCNPRTLQKPRKGGGYKIFLGGLPSNITETDLRHFFNRYGKVTEVVIMYDQEKKKSRGFGFLSFEDEGSVDCT